MRSSIIKFTLFNDQQRKDVVEQSHNTSINDISQIWHFSRSFSNQDHNHHSWHLRFQKKQFLHDGLPEGMCPKLVAGMIGETVSIAAKIKNTKLTTAKVELETWDSI